MSRGRHVSSCLVPGGTHPLPSEVFPGLGLPGPAASSFFSSPSMAEVVAVRNMYPDEMLAGDSVMGWLPRLAE